MKEVTVRKFKKSIKTDGFRFRTIQLGNPDIYDPLDVIKGLT